MGKSNLIFKENFLMQEPKQRFMQKYSNILQYEVHFNGILQNIDYFSYSHCNVLLKIESEESMTIFDLHFSLSNAISNGKIS